MSREQRTGRYYLVFVEVFHPPFCVDVLQYRRVILCDSGLLLNLFCQLVSCCCPRFVSACCFACCRGREPSPAEGQARGSHAGAAGLGERQA